MHSDNVKLRAHVQEFGEGVYRFSFAAVVTTDLKLEMMLLFDETRYGRSTQPSRAAGTPRTASGLWMDSAAPLHSSSCSVTRSLGIFTLSIKLAKEDKPADIPVCKPADYARGEWYGLWSKQATAAAAGGVSTSPLHQTPASAGWAYRLLDCRFRLFGVEEAWQCLDQKWLLFNGDSNHVDTVYNLLYHVLALPVYSDDDKGMDGFECDCVSHHSGRTFDVKPTRKSSSTGRHAAHSHLASLQRAPHGPRQ